MKQKYPGLLAGVACGLFFLQFATAQSWILTSAPVADWSSLAASADGLKLAAGAGSDGVFLSSSSGAIWTKALLPTQAWRAVAISSNGTVLAAVADGGTIFVSTNSGAAWTASSAPSDHWSGVALSADGSVMTATVDGGLIYTSTDSGGTWTATAAPSFSWQCIACSADGTKVVAGATGQNSVYVSLDSGATWRACAGLPNDTWHVATWSAVACSADGSRMVAQSRRTLMTDPGQIYFSSDSGTTWTLSSAPWYQYWGCLAASSDLRQLVAGGNFGPIDTSINFGATWSQAFGSGPWTAAAASADGSELLVGASGGGIYVFGNLSPIIIAQPANQTNDFGSVAGFSVQAVGAGTLSYQWQRDGTNLTDGGKISGSSTTDLSVSDLSDGDAVAYRVIVSNPYGSLTSAVATLRLIQPAIQSQPSDQLVVATTTASFSVTAAGDVPLTYQWRRNGTNLADVGNVLGSGSSNLMVLNVAARDAANYDVVITNFSGSATSSVAVLTVANLGILTQPASLIIQPRSTANFSVVAAGTPTLGYHWGKDGTDLVDGANVSGALTANLSVRNVTYANEGNYSVVVNNSSNSVTSGDASLLVQTWQAGDVPLGNYGSVNWGPVALSADGRKCVAAVLYDLGPYENHIGAPIYISTNWGSTWLRTSAPEGFWTALASSADGNTLVASATGSGIYVSTNSGATWVLTPAPAANWSGVATSADGVKSAAAVNGGGIFTSTDSGASWAQTTAPGTNWTGIAASADGNNLVAVVSGGGIYASTNSGNAWRQTSAPDASWSAVACSSDGTRLAAAISGDGVYTSTDSGGTWTLTSAPQQSWTSIASSADGNQLVAAALFDYLYRSIDSGTSWSHLGSPWAYWASVASSANGGRLMAATFGAIFTWPAQPSLSVALVGTNLTLSWPSFATGYQLFQNDDPTGTNWLPVPGTVHDNGTIQSQDVPPTASSRFYQLLKP
jgi:photosystem II stability/assembly factor-like uncharacterized protein